MRCLKVQQLDGTVHRHRQRVGAEPTNRIQVLVCVHNQGNDALAAVLSPHANLID